MGSISGSLVRGARSCCFGVRQILLTGALSTTGLVHAPLAVAQSADSLWISDRGSRADAEPWVLLSGVLGGLAGYRRIERGLLAAGHRVIVIDPYLMSIDSGDVSFDALARRVSSQLVARGVGRATVVGHAHGGGVAVRLAAANSPGLVSQLFLLNVGALSGNKSPVFSASMRLASLVAHMPGGKRFMRGRIVAGIRENSGQTAWLDERTAHAYTDGPLDNIGAVVRLAERLGHSQEPEPLSAVIARIKVPVTLLLGALTCPASPGKEELIALKPLGELVRTIRIEGTCHFPHEEAPDIVLQYFARPW